MNWQEIAQKFAKVVLCEECDPNQVPNLLRNETFDVPQPGYIGRDYEKKRVLLVGQNPGKSPPQRKKQDEKYAEYLKGVAQEPNEANMKILHDFLFGDIQTWDVWNYFPLKEANLQFGDIAYLNLVRCRTNCNSPPTAGLWRVCRREHFEPWLDWLKPNVVVCIGKWSHDRVKDSLARGIPHDFVQRRTSSIEHRNNLERVARLIKSCTLI